jgi:hypothetical protein
MRATITPEGCARGALYELCYPGPFYERLDCAIWYLTRLRSIPGVDPALIELTNDSCDQMSTPKERGLCVAKVIFQLLSQEERRKAATMSKC